MCVRYITLVVTGGLLTQKQKDRLDSVKMRDFKRFSRFSDDRKWNLPDMSSLAPPVNKTLWYHVCVHHKKHASISSTWFHKTVCVEFIFYYSQFYNAEQFYTLVPIYIIMNWQQTVVNNYKIMKRQCQTHNYTTSYTIPWTFECRRTASDTRRTEPAEKTCRSVSIEKVPVMRRNLRNRWWWAWRNNNKNCRNNSIPRISKTRPRRWWWWRTTGVRWRTSSSSPWPLLFCISSTVWPYETDTYNRFSIII